MSATCQNCGYTLAPNEGYPTYEADEGVVEFSCPMCDSVIKVKHDGES